MRTRVGADAYRELNDYLELAGSENVQDVDLAPATIVHDLSRFPRNKPGYVRGGIAHSHPGADTQRSEQTRAGLVQARAPGRSSARLATWLVDWSVLVTAASIANFTRALVGYTIDANQPTGQDEQAILLDRYSVPGVEEIVVGDGIAVLTALSAPRSPHAPIYFPAGSRSAVHLVSVSSGAITSVRLTTLWWIGPANSTPPGMG